MKRKGIFLIFLLLPIVYLHGNTLFIYSYEIIEGETIRNDRFINEGMMDELFETAYIAFDNLTENNKILFKPKENLHNYLKMAKQGGARYFLAMNSVSRERKKDPEKGEIDSTVDYFLYNAKTSELMGSGQLSRSLIFDKDSQLEKFFFEIGREIIRKSLTFLPKKNSDLASAMVDF